MSAAQREELAEARRERGLAEGDALSILAADALRYPLLSSEEELALARRVKLGDKAARERMIQCNLRLVIDLAKRAAERITTTALDAADLTQEGVIGLMRAVNGFDPSMGYKFSTYATWWIRQAINRAIETSGDAIRRPAYVHALESRIARLSNAFEMELGRTPTAAELALALGDVSEATVRLTQQAALRVISYDMPQDGVSGRRYNPQKRDETLSLLNLLADTHAGDDLEDAAARVDLEALDARVAAVMTQLIADPAHRTFDVRAARILWLRFGQGMTLEATADQIQADGLTRQRVSRERIRQIEADALRVLRQALQVAPSAAAVKVTPPRPPYSAEHRARLSASVKRTQQAKQAQQAERTTEEEAR